MTRAFFGSTMVLLVVASVALAEEYKGVKIKKVTDTGLILVPDEKMPKKLVEVQFGKDTRYFDAEDNEKKGAKGIKLFKSGKFADVTTEKVDAKKLLGDKAPKGEIEVITTIKLNK
jgi:hypothetical protein